MSQRQMMMKRRQPDHGMGMGVIISVLLWVLFAVIRSYV
jgi:hypothetical protein